jgi:hypothetical protein
MLFLANFSIYAAAPEKAEMLAAVATGLFILPYFLFSALAGQLIARSILWGDDRWRLFSPFELVWAGGTTGRVAGHFVSLWARGASSAAGVLARYREGLRKAAGETLAMAGVGADQIGTVILVGGSSLMGLVAEEAQALCPKASVQSSDAFTAVVDGLALATGQEFVGQ